MLYDLHTHTVFSHGKGTPRENIEAALKLGLEKIAISDHGMGHVSYGIRNCEAYLEEIRRLKDEYAGKIEVLSGIECNLLGENGETEMNDSLLKCFDVRILGYHKFIAAKGFSYTAYCYLTGRKNIQRNTRAVLRALERGAFSILAHPGYAMPVDIAAVAKCCCETDTLFEINEKHGEMNDILLRIAAEEGTKFILSSDAHSPGKVGHTQRGEKLVKAAGIADSVVNL